jgi:hypothetical protein
MAATGIKFAPVALADPRPTRGTPQRAAKLGKPCRGFGKIRLNIAANVSATAGSKRRTADQQRIIFRPARVSAIPSKTQALFLRHPYPERRGPNSTLSYLRTTLTSPAFPNLVIGTPRSE